MNQQSPSSLNWPVADLLRRDFRQIEYSRVVFPVTVLPRLDRVHALTKEAALMDHADKQKLELALEPFVQRQTALDFYNVSSVDMSNSNVGQR